MKIKQASCLVLVASLLIATLSGCGSDSFQNEILGYQSQNESIHITMDVETNLSSKNDITWAELDQLSSFKTLRKTVDDTLQVIKFDTSSKNGCIFINTDGDWDGNNTLYNAFQNKKFVEEFWSNGRMRSALAEASIDTFSDVTSETMGITATVNAYWNLLPTNKDGTSGLTDYTSRAEAMTAIYRGDTEVTYLENNEAFDEAVGDSQYNIYAANLADCSFLDYTNGSLCYDTYTSAITKAEVIYMIVQRYWPDEYANTASGDAGYFVSTSNAGDVAESLGIKGGYAWQAYELEYCNQTGIGCPDDLYRALVVAYNHGIIASDFVWNEPLMIGKMLTYLTDAYEATSSKTFAVNAKLGDNVGESLIEIATADTSEDEPEDEEGTEYTEETIGSVVVSQVRDVTNLDDLFKIYGDEINMTDEEIAQAYEVASQFTFSAADQWMEVAHCSALNIRTGPSVDYDIISCIPAGTKCHIVAVCNETGWYRIIADGKIVYQCGVYFQDFEGSEDYLMRTGENANDF
jgi:hypothetical protein